MVDVSDLTYEPHDLVLPEGDLWVFGYGSLIWNPGFEYLETHRAQIFGYHRALCVWSWVHRGTRDAPGLVMGMDIGGSCIGQAYRISEDQKHDVADYLYRREMVTPVYVPLLKPVRLLGTAPATSGRSVTALTFGIDRRNPQYAGKLSVDEAYKTASVSKGRSGENPEYVISAQTHLAEMGIRDHWLKDLADKLKAAGLG